MNQELKDIFIEVAKGITHQYDEDIQYIAQQIEKYRDHERNSEIIRKLGALYYDLLPENNKHDLVKVIQMDEENVYLLFFLAQYLISQKEWKKAEDILSIIVKEIETWESKEELNHPFSFDNLIELLLYAQTHNPEKEILRSKFPLHEFYRSIAAIAFANKDMERALQLLDKALFYNPIDIDLLLDIAEIHLAMDDQEQFFSHSVDALQLVYELEPMARCYRNIGAYYLQAGNYETATASYYMSLIFEKHDLALKALYRIYELTKQELETPNMDEITAVLQQVNLQVGASTLVVDTLLQLAKEYDEMSERKDAIHYLQMAYRLTNDDSLMDVITEMTQSLETEQVDE